MRTKSRREAVAREDTRYLFRLSRDITERSPLPMAVAMGRKHTVRYANPAFCRLTGKEKAELIGQPFADIAPKREMNTGLSLLDHVYLTGAPEAVEDGENHGDGGKAAYWSYSAWALLNDELHPAGVIVQVTDTTEAALARQESTKANEDIREINQELLIARIHEHQLAEAEDVVEQQMLHSQKMEGIGRLAGGIAHDFNNILTVILGSSDLAEQTLQTGDIALKYLHTIKKAGERAASLTSQLLAFSRKQFVEPKIIDLNALILEESLMLGRLIGENIEFVFSPKPGVGAVMIDPGQLEQVLMNLVVNARDAMPDGGKITIQTTNVTLKEEYVRRHNDATPGDYVLLAVSDTGTGMTREIRAHLFEPFFTTKEQGKGTGLGLATCYGIVRQSGGHIRVQSEPGEGTTFNIYLPRIAETDSTSPQVTDPSLVMGGAEVVLLVEDEPMVREIGAITLRCQGYTVLEAENGTEAVRLIHEYPGRIDIVLTDMIMPQLGGIGLADSIRVKDPHIKVLFVSGYTDDAKVHQRLIEPGVAFLQKPFTPEGLARKVRDVLDGVTNGKLQ